MMSKSEKVPNEPEFEEEFDDLELQAIFAASLASVTGRYDASVSLPPAPRNDAEPL
jgi:hypothetical protein